MNPDIPLTFHKSHPVRVFIHGPPNPSTQVPHTLTMGGARAVPIILMSGRGGVGYFEAFEKREGFGKNRKIMFSTSKKSVNI